ncbi:urease accessory protein UreD [Rubrivivax albus]|uniref:Urease accessory protein UreD n=1 Tax=Rubrivivax albus TaxID=2499835 RepID=A0A3S2WS47_9BURK|nr:urease accessory protein UreD [Rubrivivax albus]RVT49354.1 urease accessory protein UreD [Rubrivivax albus]
MVWSAHLALHYRRDGGRTVAHDRHEGPLRVLQALYPEGPDVCHHVVVHPPGGIVGGDSLVTDLQAEAGTHALVTTPGAAKFYRSAGPQAVQQARLRVDDGARLEWLPLETIAYRGCQARNEVHLDLAPGAQMIGWDVLALGLPAGGEAFDHGRFTQQLHWPGVWLEQGTVDGTDTRLLDSPLGWAGQRVLATAWIASGTDWPAEQRDALLSVAREQPAAPGVTAGATSTDPRLVLLRALAPRVEPAMQLLQAVRAAWRRTAWALDAHPPRIWRT